MVLGFLELMQTLSGLLCPSWLFQSFLFLSLIYLCPHFMFLSKLGTCPAILFMQLLSVLIQPQPPATLPSVHGWVHAELLSCWPHGTWRFLPSEGLSFGGVVLLGDLLCLTHVHSWKCVDKNCFPVFLRDMPVSELRVLSRKGGREQVSLLHGVHRSTALRFPCLHAFSSPSYCPVFCLAPALATEAFLCSQG